MILERNFLDGCMVNGVMGDGEFLCCKIELLRPLLDLFCVVFCVLCVSPFCLEKIFDALRI